MKIMVGYDGSNSAKEAFSLALSHAKAMGAALVVATSMMRGRDTEREAIKDAENGLAWVKERSAEASIDCTTHLLIRGMSVGEDVVAFSQDAEVDLIYIGTRRRSRVGKLLMGSNAQYIILNAPCPVTTTR